jgi:Na+-translocating ferredoxin:NAD+ oxidoreductase RNF subunit RnfB
VHAIPIDAKAGHSIVEIMRIDGLACATQCQPFGAERMAEHFAHIFGSPTTTLAQERARETTTRQLFHNVAVMRHGAYTGCNRCELVCPVGDDYPILAQEMGWT